MFDLLGYGRLERIVEALVKLCEPCLRLCGVHCALLYSDARPRRPGTVEALAGRISWEGFERRLRAEFGALIVSTAPDSQWRPAVGLAGIYFGHAMSVGLAAHALWVATGLRTIVITRAGATGELLARLVQGQEADAGRGVRVARVLPSSRVDVERLDGRPLPVVATPGAVAEGALLVAQSAAIRQSLEEVASELRVMRPAVRQLLVDDMKWHSLVAGSVQDDPGPGDEAASLRFRGVLDGPGLVAATRAASDVSAAVVLLRQLRPKVVIVGNDRFGAGAVVVSAARKVGIRTVLVQDGIAADIPPWWVSTAEVICSSGRQLHDIVKRSPCLPHKLIETGQPRSHSALLVKKARTVFSLAAGKPHLHLVVILQVHHRAGYCDALFDCISFVAGSGRVVLDVSVRCHPQHRGAVGSHVTRSVATRGWRLDEAPSPLTSLASASIVVGEYSTVLVEATLAGIPAASFEPTLVPPPISLGELGVAVPFASGEELLAICMRSNEEVLASLAQASPMAKYLLGEADLGEARRVATIVATLLDG